MSKRTPTQTKNLHAALIHLITFDIGFFDGGTFMLDPEEDIETGCLIHHLFHDGELPPNTLRHLSKEDVTRPTGEIFNDPKFVKAVEKDYGPGSHTVFRYANEDREDFTKAFANFIKTGEVPYNLLNYY